MIDEKVLQKYPELCAPFKADASVPVTYGSEEGSIVNTPAHSYSVATAPSPSYSTRADQPLAPIDEASKS
jgi:hypothetical protein